jgi:hypothetical protein
MQLLSSLFSLKRQVGNINQSSLVANSVYRQAGRKEHCVLCLMMSRWSRNPDRGQTERRDKYEYREAKGKGQWQGQNKREYIRQQIY